MKPGGVSPVTVATVVLINSRHGDVSGPAHETTDDRRTTTEPEVLTPMILWGRVMSPTDPLLQIRPSKESEQEGPQGLASTAELLRYATWFDGVCVILGLIGSGVTGAAQPYMMVLFSDILADIGSLISGNSTDAVVESVNVICIQLSVLGGILFVAAWIAEACFKSAELSSRVAESTQAIEEGISSKLSLGARYLFQGLAGMILSFYYKWDMALVLHP
ncbi:hypothetical protein T484DRAFT_1835114 [Baffinella frigidus]|nr:hypothetical protein T484DRAFT_1835114 [Cryptophyta sp. CCMP2293]